MLSDTGVEIELHIVLLWRLYFSGVLLTKLCGRLKAHMSRDMSHPVEKPKTAVVLTLMVFWIGAAVADEVTIPARQLSGRFPNRACCARSRPYMN